MGKYLKKPLCIPIPVYYQKGLKCDSFSPTILTNYSLTHSLTLSLSLTQTSLPQPSSHPDTLHFTLGKLRSAHDTTATPTPHPHPHIGDGEEGREWMRGNEREGGGNEWGRRENEWVNETGVRESYAYLNGMKETERKWTEELRYTETEKHWKKIKIKKTEMYRKRT